MTPQVFAHHQFYRPEFENYINDHKIIQTTKTQNMMMYQILRGHVNYALGKTRMQVKKTKRHFILDSCLY
jgi:hypothetical protein